MIYVYKCPACSKETEVEHSMNEVDNPSVETQLKTSCNANTCQGHEDTSEGLKWHRVPQVVNQLTYGQGTYDKGGTKTKEQKTSHFAKRSAEDGKKNGVEEQKYEKSREIVKQFK